MYINTKHYAVLQCVTMVLFFRPSLPVVGPSMYGILQPTSMFTYLRDLPTSFVTLLPAVHFERAITTTKRRKWW